MFEPWLRAPARVPSMCHSLYIIYIYICSPCVGLFFNKEIYI